MSRLRSLRPSLTISSLLCACACSSALTALDVSEDVPALSSRLQAQWRQAPLEAVLSQLAGAAGTPLILSDSMKKLVTGHALVTFLDRSDETLSQLLRELEVVQELQISFTSAGMLVETAAEADARPLESRMCWEDQSPPLPPLRFIPTAARPISFGGVAAPEVGPDWQGIFGAVAELLVASIESPHPTATISLSDGKLFISDHPHRLTLLQHRLDAIESLRSDTQLIRVTFGVVKSGVSIPDGIIGNDDALKLRQQLQQARTIEVEATSPAKPANPAEARQEHLIVSSLDIVASQYEPLMETMYDGMSVRLQRLPSLIGPLLQVSATIQDEITQSQRQIEGGYDVTGNATFAQHRRHTIDLPTRWSWMPDLRVAIPEHHALAMQTRHPNGQAVLLIEPADSPDAVIPRTIALSSKPLPLSSQLESIAQACHAGLVVTRDCQLQANWTAPVALPASATWAELVPLLAALHVYLTLEGSRLCADATSDSGHVLTVLPLWSLTQAVAGRAPNFLGFQEYGQRFNCPPFNAVPQLDFPSFLSGVPGDLLPKGVDAKASTIDNGMMVFQGSATEAARFTSWLAAAERAKSSGWWWRVYALGDDVPAAADREIISAAQWQQLKDSQRTLLSSFGSSLDDRADAYSGTQHRIIMVANVVQSLLEPLVSDVISGMHFMVKARREATGVKVSVTMRTASEQAMEHRPVLNYSGKPVITLDLPMIDISQTSRQATLPPGGALVLTCGGIRYALTCSALQP